MPQSTSFDFGGGLVPVERFVLLENIIEDRGSRYAVSYGLVKNREDIKLFLKELKRDKHYARATHNTWAARISHAGAVYETKADDGEVGAGLTILRVMQQTQMLDSVVCVTRWFGGVKLMGDRFRHVQDAAKLAAEDLLIRQ